MNRCHFFRLDTSIKTYLLALVDTDTDPYVTTSMRSI